MAQMSNMVSLIGNVGTDPEIKSTKDTTVAKFSLGVNKRVGGEKKTNWFQVTSFGKQAEIVEEHIAKGDKVGVLGRLEVDNYEKDGKKMSFTYIVAESIEFLTSKKDSESSAPPPAKKAAKKKVEDQVRYEDDDDTEQEYPF